ncbi:MAG: hypothetical protein MI919_40320 [Holophagales bacterium]|nr:hypothetical protein [Holophagales bacterium]
MSSSTSSSDRRSRSGSRSADPATAAPRVIYLKVFLAVTLGMAASLAGPRLFTMANDVSGETILGRVLQAKAALPRIVAEERDLVMAFGSSMTDAGFAARTFDRQMAERGVEVKSFNFGFGGLNPYFQDFLTHRIRDNFQQNDRRLKLALIEFVPFQATGARWQGAQQMVDSFVPLLASAEEMWAITREDPERGTQMLTIRYLRDGISAEMITHYFGEALEEPRERSRLPVDEEASERLREISNELEKRFEEDYPDYVESRWSYEWQGAGTIAEERSASTLELFEQYYEARRTPRRMENDELNRIRCCDIEELRFEETLVAAFIRIVQTFQEFSDHVEVVLLPRNTEWIRYSDEAQARLDAVLERIHAETGVRIRNFQLLEGISPEMYSDTTHLARYSGDVAFTAHLVREYAPLLGASPAPEDEPPGEDGN